MINLEMVGTFSSTFPLVSDGDFDDSRFNVVILGNLISLPLLLSSLIVNFFKLVIEEFGESLTPSP